jgi:putative MATE family efflux protein
VKLSALTGDRKFLGKVIAVGLPIAMQNLLVNSATMIDTIMIGTQGELAVAAVGICSQFASLFFSAFFGFTSGGIMFFSQFWGARDEDGICRAYGLVTSCMMVVGLLFGGAAVFAPQWILGIYTDKQEIINEAVPYLRILGMSFPFQAISFAISSLLRSTERVKLPLIASIIAQATNVLINWLLIFGKFGLPRMGTPGAAVGTLASMTVNAIILYAFCIKEKDSMVLRISRQFRWSVEFLRQYFGKCTPIIANEIFYGVGQLVINIVMGRQAAAGIAAMAVFRVIERLIFAFFSGFTNASAIIVGKQIGAGEHHNAYRDAKRFAFLCPAVTCALCVLLTVFRVPLLGAFGLSGESMRYGMYMLAFYILAGTLRTCNYIINDTFRASGESVFGTVIELLSLFLISMPAVIIAGIVLKLPFLIVFSVVFLDDAARIGIMLWYLRSGRWVKPVTDEGISALPAFQESLQRKKSAG